jgi:hypothetical protein
MWVLNVGWVTRDQVLGSHFSIEAYTREVTELVLSRLVIDSPPGDQLNAAMPVGTLARDRRSPL